MDVVASLLMALTGLPALGIAAWYARMDDAHHRGLAVRWALVAVSILLGALGLYFAGDSQAAASAVGVAMVVAVNVLVVSMILHMRRGQAGRPPR